MFGYVADNFDMSKYIIYILIFKKVTFGHELTMDYDDTFPPAQPAEGFWAGLRHFLAGLRF